MMPRIGSLRRKGLSRSLCPDKISFQKLWNLNRSKLSVRSIVGLVLLLSSLNQVVLAKKRRSLSYEDYIRASIKYFDQHDRTYEYANTVLRPLIMRIKYLNEEGIELTDQPFIPSNTLAKFEGPQVEANAHFNRLALLQAITEGIYSQLYAFEFSEYVLDRKSAETPVKIEAQLCYSEGAMASTLFCQIGTSENQYLKSTVLKYLANERIREEVDRLKFKGGFRKSAEKFATSANQVNLLCQGLKKASEDILNLTDQDIVDEKQKNFFHETYGTHYTETAIADTAYQQRKNTIISISNEVFNQTRLHLQRMAESEFGVLLQMESFEKFVGTFDPIKCLEKGQGLNDFSKEELIDSLRSLFRNASKTNLNKNLALMSNSYSKLKDQIDCKSAPKCRKLTRESTELLIKYAPGSLLDIFALMNAYDAPGYLKYTTDYLRHALKDKQRIENNKNTVKNTVIAGALIALTFPVFAPLRPYAGYALLGSVGASAAIIAYSRFEQHDWRKHVRYSFATAGLDLYNSRNLTRYRGGIFKDLEIVNEADLIKNRKERARKAIRAANVDIALSSIDIILAPTSALTSSKLLRVGAEKILGKKVVQRFDKYWMRITKNNFARGKVNLEHFLYRANFSVEQMRIINSYLKRTDKLNALIRFFSHFNRRAADPKTLELVMDNFKYIMIELGHKPPSEVIRVLDKLDSGRVLTLKEKRLISFTEEQERMLSFLSGLTKNPGHRERELLQSLLTTPLRNHEVVSSLIHRNGVGNLLYWKRVVESLQRGTRSGKRVIGDALGQPISLAKRAALETLHKLKDNAIDGAVAIVTKFDQMTGIVTRDRLGLIQDFAMFYNWFPNSPKIAELYHRLLNSAWRDRIITEDQLKALVYKGRFKLTAQQKAELGNLKVGDEIVFKRNRLFQYWIDYSPRTGSPSGNIQWDLTVKIGERNPEVRHKIVAEMAERMPKNPEVKQQLLAYMNSHYVTPNSAFVISKYLDLNLVGDSIENARRVTDYIRYLDQFMYYERNYALQSINEVLQPNWLAKVNSISDNSPHAKYLKGFAKQKARVAKYEASQTAKFERILARGKPDLVNPNPSNPTRAKPLTQSEIKYHSREMAKSRARLYEENLLGCRSKHGSMHRLYSAKAFTSFNVTVGPIATALGYLKANMNRDHKGAEFALRLIFDMFFDRFKKLGSAKIHTNNMNDLLDRYFKYYLFDGKFGAAVDPVQGLIVYLSKKMDTGEFASPIDFKTLQDRTIEDWTRSDPELGEKVNHIFALMEELDDKMKNDPLLSMKFEFFYQELANILKNKNPREADLDLLVKIQKGLFDGPEEHNEEMKDLMEGIVELQTALPMLEAPGYPGNEVLKRWQFHRVYGAMAAGFSLLTSQTILRMLCFGTQTPKLTYASAVSTFFIIKYIQNWVYYAWYQAAVLKQGQ